MARNGRWVEAGLLGLVVGLAGCATPEPEPDVPRPGADPRPERASGTPPPDNVDYVFAVQCGGLLWALEAVSEKHFRAPPLLSVTGLYREWAELRAREAGNDPALALPDLAASRDNFLAAAGGGPTNAIEAELRVSHEGDIDSCRSLARNADFDIVIIGG